MKPGPAPCASSEWKSGQAAWQPAPAPAGMDLPAAVDAHGVCAAWVCGSLVALGFLIAAPCALAASPFSCRERLHRPLGPLAEKALAALADKAEMLERTLMAGHMASLLDEMDRAVALTAQEREALELDATSMVNAAVKSWKECVVADLRPLLAKDRDDESQAERAGGWSPGQVVPFFPVRRWTPPDELPAWTRAVEKRLGAERAACWEKECEARQTKAQAVISRFADRWALLARQPMDAACADHLRVLCAGKQVSQPQADRIAQLARGMVDDHVAAEVAEARDMLRSVQGEPLQAFLQGTKSLASRFLRPTDAELAAAWRRLAAGVAGEAALQQWDRDKTDKEQQRQEEKLAALKAAESRERAAMEDLMRLETEKLDAVLKLSEAKRKELAALAAKAVEESLAVSRPLWQRTLDKVTAEEMEKHQLPRLFIKESQEASRQETWLKGLRQLFTPAEMKLAAKSGGTRQWRMHRALAQAALARADTVLGLSAQQRAELEPLLMQQMSSLVPPVGQIYWSATNSALMRTVRALPRGRLSNILDEAQLRLWDELERLLPDRTRLGLALGMRHPAGPPKEPEQMLATDVDSEISQYMHRRMLTCRQEMLGLMRARVADAKRLLKLPEDKAVRLTTAAKGAVEAHLAMWRQRMDSLAQERLAGATPDNIRAMLGALDGMTCIPTGEGAAVQPVWRATVEAMLSPAERQTWDKAMAERHACSVAAMAALTTVELDRRHQLSPAQYEKVQQIVAEVVEQHWQAINSSGLTGQGWDWHLSSTSVLMPLAGVAKAELQAVLTPNQWRNFQDKDLAGAERYWQVVQRRKQLGAAAKGVEEPFLFVPQ